MQVDLEEIFSANSLVSYENPSSHNGL